MKYFHDGFFYPEVDQSLCVNCGLCAKVCPINSCTPSIYPKEAFAIKHKDEVIRQSSSSGGAFSAIASKIIVGNGVCFGAALDDTFSVVHTECCTLDELHSLRGSKYSQSKVGHTLREAKKLLERGKTVLFSGTPCQIAGLKSYLGKDYENLITVDFICHGVPSSSLLRKYLDFMQSSANSKICNVSFRDKTYGWKNFSMKIGYSNQPPVISTVDNDKYLRAFLLNLFLRPSCYNCKFKDHNYQSDLTLADFWSIDKVLPQLNDDKGISLVIVNTPKGQMLLNSVHSQIDVCQVPFDEAVSVNPSYKKSCRKTLLNKKALKDSVKLDFNKVYNKYCKKTLPQQVLRKLAREFCKFK